MGEVWISRKIRVAADATGTVDRKDTTTDIKNIKKCTFFFQLSSPSEKYNYVKSERCFFAILKQRRRYNKQTFFASDIYKFLQGPYVSRRIPAQQAIKRKRCEATDFVEWESSKGRASCGLPGPVVMEPRAGRGRRKHREHRILSSLAFVKNADIARIWSLAFPLSV
jgi:hypothetical protein